MIKKENLKQAIDNISKRDPEIGYSLNEMFRGRRIDTPSPPGEIEPGGDFYFFFDKQKIPVRKFIYFNYGTAPVEQQLLIKHGELTKKQELLNRQGPLNYIQAAIEIRDAGLRLMVVYEIDCLIAQLKKDNIESYEHLISFLEKIKKNNQNLKLPEEVTDPAVLYRGLVGIDTQALFVQFPFCMDSLMQAGDINLEYFNVRFLLNCLVQGTEKKLFACVVKQKIVGFIFVKFRKEMFYKGMELKYIATLSGVSTQPVPKGIGTFLVAGIWMLWKCKITDVKEFFLDSEIGAKRFYESIGFASRNFYQYTFKNPKGHLVKSIIIMANNCKNLRPDIIKTITRIIKKQIKSLRRQAKDKKQELSRKVAIDCVKECLRPGAHPEFSKTAITMLNKYKKKIPESKNLIQKFTNSKK
ncbi:MAG: hypothetical protein Q7J15_04815 [Candidatus Desulfaltia sp.]|nr:hypothetical protein [Candidatus Desulfaltia sp.]